MTDRSRQRRIVRIARFLRQIGDPSEFLSVMSRHLHRQRLRLEATVPAYQLPAEVHAYREAIEAEIARQEGARDDVIAQAALILFHAEGSDNELQKLVFSRFPDISWDELAGAWREMRTLAIARRDYLKSEIEAGRLPAERQMLQ